MITVAHWAVFALSAAVFWGLAYTFIGRVIHAGLTTPFILTSVAAVSICVYAVTLARSNMLKSNLGLLLGNKMLILFLVVIAVALMGGQFLIYHAVSLKSATHAAILEISYLLFTFLFTMLLFRDVELSWNMIVSGLLIFTGSALIFLRSGA